MKQTPIYIDPYAFFILFSGRGWINHLTFQAGLSCFLVRFILEQAWIQ